MKYVDEFRDPGTVQRLAAEIERTVTRPWTLMEVCGGQTHSLLRFGIDQLLPKSLTLVHGPGCPVCVTPVELIDKAIELAQRSEVTLCSFGDMLRVPGTHGDLFGAKAAGADVRIVYSPLDALDVARRDPSRQVVFFAVGFETTAPANAMSVYQARALGIRNYSMLVSHVLVPPAIEAILSSADNRVQGFLAAGHVCAVMGFEAYRPIAERFHVPIVVTGFEPTDLLQGILACVRQLEGGRAEVENAYGRAVSSEGNGAAQTLIAEVFTVTARKWRGIGEIAASGFGLAPAYEEFDAELRFPLATGSIDEDRACIAGLVLKGVKKPYECPAFGRRCTPASPLGAPMVSSEGACAAYHRYRRTAS